MAQGPRGSVRIGVVGLGAVGATACIHLLRRLSKCTDSVDVQLHTFEPAARVGAGLAYATRRECHVLNMRAKTMSVCGDAPDDFVAWLEENALGGAEDYVPRRHFGEYVEQRFHEAVELGRQFGIVRHHHSAAVLDCQEVRAQVLLTHAEGQIELDYVIVCPGHLPRHADCREPFEASSNFVASPWDEARLGTIGRDASVGVLGSSLTAVDVLLSLSECELQGPIVCFARRRGLPRVQGPLPPYRLRYLSHQRLRQLTDCYRRRLTLADVQAVFRLEIEAAARVDGLWDALITPRSGDAAPWLARDLADASEGNTRWYAALDATSELVPHVWRQMTAGAKARFLRDYEGLWAMFRHCMPASNARKLLALARSRSLTTQLGLEHIRWDAGRSQFELRCRDHGNITSHWVDVLVDARGSEACLARIDSPLFDNMARRGQLVPHALGGVEVDFHTSQLLQRNGQKSRRVCLIGHLTKGVHFYTNSFEMNRGNVQAAIDFIFESIRTRMERNQEDSARKN